MELGAVRRAAAPKPVTLDHALKTLPERHALDVHKAPVGKDGQVQRLPDLELPVEAAQLHDASRRIDALRELTGKRLRQPPLASRPPAQHHGVIPVACGNARADHDIGFDPHQRHRARRARIVEYLRHSHLDANYRYHAARSLLPDLDVDAGRQLELHQRIHDGAAWLQDVDEPLVSPHFELLTRLLVDVRDRSTVNLLIRVGSGIGPATRAPAFCTVCTIAREL